MKFILLKKFISTKDLNKIKKDIIVNFKKNKHKDNLNSGTQTKPNLHLIHTTPHWKRFYKKLNIIMLKINQKKIIKSWCLKINKIFFINTKRILLLLYFIYKTITMN